MRLDNDLFFVCVYVFLMLVLVMMVFVYVFMMVVVVMMVLMFVFMMVVVVKMVLVFVFMLVVMVMMVFVVVDLFSLFQFSYVYKSSVYLKQCCNMTKNSIKISKKPYIVSIQVLVLSKTCLLSGYMLYLVF